MFKVILRSALLLVISIVLAIPAVAQTGDIFTVTTDILNARTGPGIEYNVVGRLGQGGSYEILQYSPTRNWVLLDIGYTQAWVFRHLGDVLSLRGFPPATTTTTTIYDSSLGQGGGFSAPATTVIYTPTFGRGGGFVAPTSTIPTVTETGVDLSVTSTVEEFNSTIGVTSTLRLRAAPSLSARILTAVPYDERAVPIGRNGNGTWIQINYNGAIGWGYFMYVVFPPAIDVRALPVTG